MVCALAVCRTLTTLTHKHEMIFIEPVSPTNRSERKNSIHHSSIVLRCIALRFVSISKIWYPCSLPVHASPRLASGNKSERHDTTQHGTTRHNPTDCLVGAATRTATRIFFFAIVGAHNNTCSECNTPHHKFCAGYRTVPYHTVYSIVPQRKRCEAR